MKTEKERYSSQQSKYAFQLTIQAMKYFCLLVLVLANASYAQVLNGYAVKPVVAPKAVAIDPADITLLPGSPFSKAMQVNEKYLRSLSADRFLHRWRKNAGLTPKAPIYEGWEANSSHMLGHYLSALALHFAATKDPYYKNQADYVVAELHAIQQARGTGYIGGIPGEDTIWQQVKAGHIRSSGFDLNGGWVPWYMLHKVWAGLLDAYRLTNNEQAKTVVTGLSDWAYNQFYTLPDSLFQRMMVAEFGGMNESLADVYAITGNKKYLDLSYKFYHRQVMQPLSERVDRLGGLHANTQIPKVIGAARQYELTGNENDHTIADFFYHTVVDHHSYVNGGNSNYEWFNQADKFANALGTNTSETCNTYNMLKLNQHLFTWSPSVLLADYYENALYNHILASQHPETGMLCYYVALQSGKQRVYSTPEQSFWCCVGTGLENHAKYTEAIYFKDTNNDLFLNLFIPSVLNWREKGIRITQQTQFPYESRTSLNFSAGKPASGALHLRCPSWSTGGMEIWLNGQQQQVISNPGQYTTITRTWKNGDRLELRFNMQLSVKSMPDAPSRAAVMYGPILLAGALGTEKPDQLGVPVIVAENKSVDEWIKPVDLQKLLFQTKGVGQPRDLSLQPFYTLYDQRYIVYWEQFTAQAWLQKKADYEKELQRLAEQEKRTVDVVRLGEQQSEKDHDLTGSNTGIGTYDERKFRDAPNGGWFSFNMKVNDQPLQLVATYNGSDGRGRAFSILADGVMIAEESLKAEKPGSYVEHVYTIPTSITQGKKSITIRFQAQPKNIAGALFEARIIQ
jgi:DUF1680 family protein